MEFTYSIEAQGHGFARFSCTFKRNWLLTLLEIEILTMREMREEGEKLKGGWQETPQMKITRIRIRAGE